MKLVRSSLLVTSVGGSDTRFSSDAAFCSRKDKISGPLADSARAHRMSSSKCKKDNFSGWGHIAVGEQVTAAAKAEPKSKAKGQPNKPKPKPKPEKPPKKPEPRAKPKPAVGGDDEPPTKNKQKRQKQPKPQLGRSMMTTRKWRWKRVRKTTRFGTRWRDLWLRRPRYMHSGMGAKHFVASLAASARMHAVSSRRMKKERDQDLFNFGCLAFFTLVH